MNILGSNFFGKIDRDDYFYSLETAYQKARKSKGVFFRIPFDSKYTSMARFFRKLKLPERPSCLSAGYDFTAPFEIHLAPGSTFVLPTGIRIYLEPSMFLILVPKGRISFESPIQIIDESIMYDEQLGHISIALKNNGNETLYIRQGDIYAQGIFTPYSLTCDDRYVMNNA